MKNTDDSSPQFQSQRSQNSKSRNERRSGALNKRNNDSVLSYKFVKAAVNRLSGFLKSIFVGGKKDSSDRSVLGSREVYCEFCLRFLFV